MSYQSHHALIFDSGVGGLSVVGDMRQLMPDLHLSFLADDLFRPYGEKSKPEIVAHLPALLRVATLMLKPDIVVIACNSASTAALDEVRAVLDCPVVGVVPAIKPAAAISRTKTIGVLGTRGTVRREYVNQLIHEFASDCTVRLLGAPSIVDMAEGKLAGQPVDLDALRAAIAPLFDGRAGVDLDAVVLACTHFPLIVDELKAVTRQTVQWVDSGAAVARRVKTVLADVVPNEVARPHPQTAFLVGPEISEARESAFSHYGFERVVALEP